jgi:Domain of unknown function (DUF5134)
MLVPGLSFGLAGGWEMAFGAAAGWFGWQALASRRSRTPAGHRPAQHVQHLLACLAMLYMLLAAGPAASGAAAGHPGTGVAVGLGSGTTTHLPTLALLLALALLGSVINTADRLTALPLTVAGAAARPAPPLDAGAATAAVPPGHAQPGAPARPGPAAAARTPALSPRLAACCDIAMGVTMGYLLVLMISS